MNGRERASSSYSAQLAPEVTEIKCRVDFADMNVWAYVTEAEELECPSFSKCASLAELTKRTEQSRIR